MLSKSRVVHDNPLFISIYFRAVVVALMMHGFIPVLAADAMPMDVINGGRTMIAAGRSVDAYQYLIQYEEQYAGIPEYDYLLGVAAIDSGNANYAVLALQRTVAVNPKFIGARLDLGRSYFLLQQYDDARNEFEDALNYDPPSPTKKLIKQYLDMINKQTRRWGEFGLTFNANGTAGSDSNANSATSLKSYGDYVFPDSSREAPSLFYSGSAGGGLRYFANRNWLVTTEAQYTQRKNLSASFVDYKQVDAGLNVINITDKDYIKWDLTASRLNMGSSLLNYNLFGSFFARRKSYSNNSFNYLARAGTIRYAGSDKSRDMYQAILGGGYAADLTPLMPLSTSTTFLIGRSHPVETTSLYGNFFSGLRLHSDFAVVSFFHLYAGAGLMGTLYDEKYFGQTRVDAKADGTVGAVLIPWRGFQIQPQAVYTYNYSRNELFGYQRLEYYVSTRMDF